MNQVRNAPFIISQREQIIKSLNPFCKKIVLLDAAAMTIFLALTCRSVCNGTVKAELLKELEIDAECCHSQRHAWVWGRDEHSKEFMCFDFSPHLLNKTCEK